MTHLILRRVRAVARLVAVAMVCGFSVTTLAEIVWKPTLDDTPTLHTTELKLGIDLASPVPEKITIDVTMMGEASYRATVATKGQSRIDATLTTKDFACVNAGKTDQPLRFTYVTSAKATDASVKSMTVSWAGSDGVVYPWEVEPKSISADGGATFWPGLSENNVGQFGWRYEPNGLLIDNVSFDALDRSYWAPLVPPGEFRFGFSVPDAKPANRELITKGDETTRGQTGLTSREEYKVDAGVYANDTLETTWTSVKWRRPIETSDGKRYVQELRYSTLAPGIQVETDAPAMTLTFGSAKSTQGPSRVLFDGPNGAKWCTDRSAAFVGATDNWMVLVRQRGNVQDIPVMIVFSQRPDRIEWTDSAMTIHRAAGVGTLAIGTPFGVTAAAGPAIGPGGTPPIGHFKRFRDLLTAYAWNCKETFSVANDVVTIRNDVAFLPWEDAWKSSPKPFAPLPPMIALAVREKFLSPDAIGAAQNLKVPTKWGPYMGVPGTTIEYRLPVPKLDDFAPLGTEVAADRQWLLKILKDCSGDGAIADLKKCGGEPTIYPHNNAHDFVCGAWRTSFFMSEAQRKMLREITRTRIAGALMPQDYRLRRDPISGTEYLACTFVWEGKDVVNGDGYADIDYWQGLTVYGLFTYAKYAGDWALIQKHWPLVRSLMSYWQATNSWALMSPAARESGEMYHGDMPTAGYTGLVGFYEMSQRLGSAYERDLSAYLLAKATVPMIAKMGYGRWAKSFHPDWTAMLGTGFGECFVSSMKIPNPTMKNYEADDPWWSTGCIGPQSAQPEVLDLFMKYCGEDLRWFETVFMKACPDAKFKDHDDIRVMPHVMARTWLSAPMRRDVEAFMKTYHTGYMLRDTHALAALVAWDVPVRLLDWSPAWIVEASWNEATGATIVIDAAEETTLKLKVRPDAIGAISIDGQPAKMEIVGATSASTAPSCVLPLTPANVSPTTAAYLAGWQRVNVTVPKGTHRISVAKK